MYRCRPQRVAFRPVLAASFRGHSSRHPPVSSLPPIDGSSLPPRRRITWSVARPKFVHLPFTAVGVKRGERTNIVRGSGDTGVWSVADERSELREGEASRD